MAKLTDGTDDEARLFSVSPRNFVAERNALAKRLKDAGEAARAKAVAKLPKPTSSVWAVNQLAHRAPAELRQLSDAAARVREAATEVLRGGEGQAYLQAGRDLRAAIAGLVARASQLLEDEGLAAPPSVLRRISNTLHAAATHDDPDLREQLESGSLRSDLDAAGGFPTQGAPPGQQRPSARAPAAPAVPAKETQPAADDARLRAERERARLAAQLQQAARTARAAAAGARRELEATQRLAALANNKAIDAEREAARLRAKADAAQTAVEEARRRAEQLEKAAAEADAACNPR
jgi:hypothetical protein